MERRQGKQLTDTHIAWKQRSEEHLGHTVGRLFTWSVSLRDSIRGGSPPGTRNWLATFPSPTPRHKHRATCGNKHSANTPCLTCSHQAQTPYAPVETPFPVKLASVPVQQALPQKTGPNPCQRCISPPGSFAKPQFTWW